VQLLMTDVKMILPGAARGAMATKLLEAADHLGLPASVIRSQARGFLVPEEVHAYLFPSEYDGGSPDPDVDGDTPDAGDPDQYDEMEFPELRETAKKRDLSAGGSADEIKARLREADAAATQPGASE
jgi:hypothetical protein